MIKRMAAIGLAVFGMAASTLIPSTAYAAANEYKLEVLAQKGNGCLPGTVEKPTYDDENKIFNLVYNDFTVKGGQMKTCQLTLMVHVPAGISYSVYQLTNRGMGYLTGRAKALQTVSAYFAGDSRTMNQDERFSAPLGENGFAAPWQVTATWVGEEPMWSDCGGERKMFVKNNLQVIGDKKNTMTLQDTDLKVSTYFYVEFQPC